ncbi:MAG TPA: hypothetical protein PK867_27490, partial [Pirellulales bacterium]|nr:hypothetical protein [Pirellulales bacterium]
LEQVIWAEILTLLQRSSVRLPIAVNRLRLRATAWDGGDSGVGRASSPSARFRSTTDGLGRPPHEFVPKHEVLGCAASEPESLQGHNLPPGSDGQPSVLVVCEEASAIPDRFIEALLPQSHRLLAIGNPLRVEGWFYEGCKKGNEEYPKGSNVGWDQRACERRPTIDDVPADGTARSPFPTEASPQKLLRWVRHIHPEESPNLIRSREMDRDGETGEYPLDLPGLLSRQEFDEWNATWDEPRKRVRLYGLLPNEEEQKLYPPSWLDLAQQLGKKLCEQIERDERWRDDDPYALGIDVAYGGGDLTAWVLLGRWGVRQVYACPTPNTANISGYTIKLMRKFRIKAWAVAFDSGGGGKQIADMLRAQNDMEFGEIVDVSFGAKPLSKGKYCNRRTELYGELRTALEATDERRRLLTLPVSEWPAEVQCLALPPDDAKLRQDLAVLPHEWDSEGMMRLPPKDHVRGGSSQREQSVRERLGGRSPDRGDALVLAWFAWTRSAEYQRLERVRRPLVYP